MFKVVNLLFEFEMKEVVWHPAFQKNNNKNRFKIAGKNFVGATARKGGICAIVELSRRKMKSFL